MLNVETGHRLQEFQRVLNGPGSSQRPVEKRPIQPTNGQSAADFRTAEEVLKFSSAVLPSTKLISSTLKNKLSQLLS
ncbi:unnamed protein product [Heligmosomoides polygyrus]|uniref:HTH_48 domain-containing protein n=1 Tax=Heligmosomoides polygyrus TaxID=6339 RepID=A0A183F4P4_HELPZ|nr:unnamed protein product [Heligmosomoides polygyrus]